MRLFAATAFALTVGLAGISAAMADTLTPAQKGILSAEQAELDGWKTRNLEKIMNAYTGDTQVITGQAPVRDNAALRTAFIRFLSDPGFDLTFRSDPPIVAASGDLGVATGTYVVRITDKTDGKVTTAAGFHLLVWRKEADGQWRIQRQLTTESPHAAAVHAAAGQH